jgi:biotin operon repressor
MLTTGATGGNAATPPRAVMLSIAQLAERDGVSKPNVSRRVKQLRALGLQVELDGQGRVAAVNAVQYDELRKRTDDPSKAQAPVRTASLAPPIGESYDEALRQKTWTEAERARLKLLEEKGELVRVDRLADALSAAGERIVRAVDKVLMNTDDLAAAVAKEGTSGLRAALKKLTHEIKNDIADALAEIASAAPEVEPEDPE